MEIHPNAFSASTSRALAVARAIRVPAAS
ncbi:MAG: hypothetical protein JWR43_660, partial [Phenylobacterium sp.]|nr:hypothetical protein [Phenylobacterium sp.]